MTFLALLEAESVPTAFLVLVHDSDNANGKECDTLLIQYAMSVVQYAMCTVKHALLSVTCLLHIDLHQSPLLFPRTFILYFTMHTEDCTLNNANFIMFNHLKAFQMVFMLYTKIN